MPDVFEVLGQDHQEDKRMLAELEKGAGPAVAAADRARDAATGRGRD